MCCFAYPYCFFAEDNLLRNFEGNLTCPSGPTWSHSRSCAGALVAQVAWAEDLWSPLPCWYQAIPCHTMPCHYTTLHYNTIHTYIHIDTDIHIHTCIYIYVCMYMWVRAYVYPYVHIFNRVNVCVYKCIYIYHRRRLLSINPSHLTSISFSCSSI